MRLGNKIIALLWGFAEATCFFIVPDVWLSYAALDSMRKALRACLYALAGALVGGMVMYLWGWQNAATAIDFLDWIPAISPALIAHAGAFLQHGTATGMVEGSLSGVPYKLFAVQAGTMHIPLFSFLLYSIPARLLRFVLVAGISRLAARCLLRHWNISVVCAIHLSVWVVFYIGYFSWMEN